MRLRTNTLVVVVAGLLLIAAGLGRAQTAQLSEYQLKAAFLYNFAKFIEWPQSAFPGEKSPFIIGILGDDPFGPHLEPIVAGKKINEHPIVIQPFREIGGATNCHILFISTSEKKRLPEIIGKLHGTTILTVGETERFIEAGGMVNFLQVGSKLRFQINDDAAKIAKLKISSKLLGLAVSGVR